MDGFPESQNTKGIYNRTMDAMESEQHCSCEEQLSKERLWKQTTPEISPARTSTSGFGCGAASSLLSDDRAGGGCRRWLLDVTIR